MNQILLPCTVAEIPTEPLDVLYRTGEIKDRQDVIQALTDVELKLSG